MPQQSHQSRERPFVELMSAAGMPDEAIRTFLLHYRRVTRGELGFLPSNALAPVGDVTALSGLDWCSEIGEQCLDQVATIKLNGGLGTSMGLNRAKSLLQVRNEFTFLDLIARQILHLRKTHAPNHPLLLMNSFRTESDSLDHLSGYAELPNQPVSNSFLQHRSPKILASDLTPARSSEDPDLEWCPPGHGDIYTALATSGTLSELLHVGIRYAFVSNSDNLGAVIDPRILGFMIESGLDFVMEVSGRTTADRKGGHLCRLNTGRLALREIAQCPADDIEDFQDVRKHSLFNTNNIWIHLPAVADILERNQGAIPLPTIVNRKSLDPRNPDSPAVIQLETALGAAIQLFDRTAAIEVPRSRFSPVKNTNDLLAVRSDAFFLTPDSRLVLDESRSEPPRIQLDSRYFRLIDDFEARFASGPPSLRRCRSFMVEGDVFFEREIVATGEVEVRSVSGQKTVAAEQILDAKVVLE